MSQKSAIKADFSRAAENYDQHAELQRTVAEKLIAFIGKISEHGRILDLGSGTGYMRKILRQENIIETDIAFSMCKKSQSGQGITVNADMEQLPFKDEVFSALVSSLALQWLEKLDETFAETKRVLQPGGIFAFTIFGEGTLRELAESLEKCGDEKRINNFSPLQEISYALKQHFALVKHFEESLVYNYRDIFDLQRKIRIIGARKKQKSMPLSRKKVLSINEYYLHNYPSSSGIKASWNVQYFLAKKK